MRIPAALEGLAGASLSGLGGEASDLAAKLYGAGGASVDDQLEAYRTLAGQWREAKGAERAKLAQALSDSPFGQKALAVVNRFTRAAWAGADAAPPAPQEKALQAFDRLTETDRKIVAALQTDPATGAGFAAAADYRAHLQAELDAARPRPADQIVLSAAARARLAGAQTAQASGPAERPSDPQVAEAFAAYARASG